MGFYTKFHFRAKLAFDLPEPIRLMFRNQFQSGEQAYQMHDRLLRSEFGASAAVQSPSYLGLHVVGSNYRCPYFMDPRWIGHPDHKFFTLDRADCIPYSSNGERYSPPIFREYPDGSSIMEFTCEFNQAYEEIHEFLDWIRPYVRQKFGKRNRGRKQVCVGWWSSEDMKGRVDVYIKPVPTTHAPDFLFGREVVDDYRNKGTW